MFNSKEEAREYANRHNYMIIGETEYSIRVLDRCMNEKVLPIINNPGKRNVEENENKKSIGGRKTIETITWDPGLMAT